MVLSPCRFLRGQIPFCNAWHGNAVARQWARMGGIVLHAQKSSAFSGCLALGAQGGICKAMLFAGAVLHF
jgi:hypothetical protein